jgi:hypothetical protein
VPADGTEADRGGHGEEQHVERGQAAGSALEELLAEEVGAQEHRPGLDDVVEEQRGADHDGGQTDPDGGAAPRWLHDLLADDQHEGHHRGQRDRVLQADREQGHPGAGRVVLEAARDQKGEAEPRPQRPGQVQALVPVTQPQRQLVAGDQRVHRDESGQRKGRETEGRQAGRSTQVGLRLRWRGSPSTPSPSPGAPSIAVAD